MSAGQSFLIKNREQKMITPQQSKRVQQRTEWRIAVYR